MRRGRRRQPWRNKPSGCRSENDLKRHRQRLGVLTRLGCDVVVTRMGVLTRRCAVRM